MAEKTKQASRLSAFLSFADERANREDALKGERNTCIPNAVQERWSAILCLVRAREFDAIKDVLSTSPHSVVARAISQIASMGRFDVLGEIIRMGDSAPLAADAAAKRLARMGKEDVEGIWGKNMEYCGGSPVFPKAVQASVEAAGVYGSEEAGKAAFDYALSEYRKTDDRGFLLSAVNIVKSSRNRGVQVHGADRLVEFGNERALNEVERAGGEIGDYVRARRAESLGRS
ncbi:MAG: hypothetical protein PHF51_00755 [Candidatus ainarchaeum sp.]|nr:hypothetical protein [Candidatus ainarchaeum sp.]